MKIARSIRTKSRGSSRSSQGTVNAGSAFLQSNALIFRAAELSRYFAPELESFGPCNSVGAIHFSIIRSQTERVQKWEKHAQKRVQVERITPKFRTESSGTNP